MSERPQQTKPSHFAAAGIGLTIVLFLAINFLADTLLRDLRFDLTEQRLYTLSDATRELLAGLEEPITLRFYASRSLAEDDARLAVHAKRVRELLERYAAIGGDALRLEVYRPEAFSAEEEQALAEGLEPRRLGEGETLALLGLAAFDATDRSEVVGFFDPERQAFLEYDITRSIANLARPAEPRVGVLGGLPLGGQGPEPSRRWLTSRLAENFFDLRQLDAETVSEHGLDPSEIDVLLLVQPPRVSPALLYALDQYLLAGGRLLAFLDPFSEVIAAANPLAAAQATPLEDMAPLLAAWGVTLEPDAVVGDRSLARRVAAQIRGRRVVTDYLPWLALGADNLEANDAVTAPLKLLHFNTAGSIQRLPGTGSEVQPLAWSSDQALPIPVSAIRAAPDPEALQAGFMGAAARHDLAVRITGPAASAFPEGPPGGVTPRGAHRARSAGPINVILVADSDFLADAAWTSNRTAVANNADFLGNALDNLGGDEALISLRGRGLAGRPLTALEERRRAGEAALRQRQAELVETIEAIEASLVETRRKRADLGGARDAEVRAKVAELVSELDAARTDLRALQARLHGSVKRLEALVLWTNLLAAPLLVGLAALLVMLRQRRRGISA